MTLDMNKMIMMLEMLFEGTYYFGAIYDKYDNPVAVRVGRNGQYWVRKDGEVFKVYKNGSIRAMCQHPMSGGYLQVYIDNSPVLTHRLVAECFCEKPKGIKTEVNHINGNKWDNRASNLEWVTRSENMRHAYKMGLHSLTGGRNRLRSSL